MPGALRGCFFPLRFYSALDRYHRREGPAALRRPRPQRIYRNTDMGSTVSCPPLSRAALTRTEANDAYPGGRIPQCIGGGEGNAPASSDCHRCRRHTAALFWTVMPYRTRSPVRGRQGEEEGRPLARRRLDPDGTARDRRIDHCAASLQSLRDGVPGIGGLLR